jgi:hypothetical protein
VNRMRGQAVMWALGVAVLLGACGGSSATRAPAAVATAGGTTASAGASTVIPVAAPSAALSVAPLPSVGDVSNAATALSNVSSYKVSITTTGGTNPGTESMVVVRKPAFAESLTATSAGKTTRIVAVGSEVWIDEGTGTFTKEPIPASALTAMTSAFDPGTFLQRARASAPLSALQTIGVETKNGVQAVHLRGDHSTAVPAGEPSIPPGAIIDLWVASDGSYLVALEMNGLASATGPTGVKLEITNINDPSLSVSAPS